MGHHSAEFLRQRAQKLIDSQAEAGRRGEWTFFVDELYAPECVYTCEYAGVMLVSAEGVEEIKRTHYGRDMEGWEGWSFPYLGVYVGDDDDVITHWMNRGPGRRPNGDHYQTPGVSMIHYDADGRIDRQLDLFDLAHQMRLCDELDEVGALSPALKANWVAPNKQRLRDMLANR